MGVITVTIKSKQYVKPASPTWEGIMPLTEIDHIAVVSHEGFAHIYKKPNQPRHIIFETFKNALSNALVWYYPLAGRLQSIGKDRYEINCNASGVMLIEAESTRTIEDYGDFSSLDQMAEGIYPEIEGGGDPTKSPITLIQLTWLQCGGISLCYTTSQVVVDGTGFLNFIHDLARSFRGEPMVNRPMLDRQPLIEPPTSALFTYNPKVDRLAREPTLIGQTIDLNEVEIATSAVVLSKEQVGTLLNVAKQSLDGGTHRFSRFEVIAAYIWKCVAKARRNVPNQRTALNYPIEVRHRMGLPQSYFGVAITAGVVSDVVGELITCPLAQVCANIRNQTNAMNKDNVWSIIQSSKANNSLSKYYAFFTGNPNLAVTSWLTLPTRNIDYGWGKDVYMAATTLGYDGDFVLNGNNENDGSVIVSFSLNAEHIDDFKKYFYEDIQNVARMARM